MPAPSVQLISEGFGSGDASKTYPIPLASQISITPGAASFADGFPPLTRTQLDAGGIPPNGEDINGILYMLSAHMALINSGQPYQFNTDQATNIGGYGLGAVLQSATNDFFWLNTVNGNASNPDSGGAGWVPLPAAGVARVALTSGTATLTPSQAARAIIIFTGTLTGNCVVNFPANSGQNWTVCSTATMGGFTITAQTAAAGASVNIPGGGFSQAQGCFSDGFNLFSNNVSTAGLAPLANPNFSGVPTAPTAAANSNTTQIATTAQVQAAIAAATSGLAPKASPTLSGSPTVPTPAPGNNSALIANTAFVQAAIAALPSAPIIKRGAFASVNGIVTVELGYTFPGPPTIMVQWNYNSPDVGWVVPGSITDSSFQYQCGNGGTCLWLAVYN
jgi:hypothetical protein